MVYDKVEFFENFSLNKKISKNLLYLKTINKTWTHDVSGEFNAFFLYITELFTFEMRSMIHL